MGGRRQHREPEVVRITTAPESPSADVAHRQRRYVISMAIRTLCFLAAVVVGWNWIGGLLMLAAFVLPYLAVVVANSASPRVEGTLPPGPAPGTPELDGPDVRRPEDEPWPRDV